MNTDAWAIDTYGLLVAHRRSVLDRIQETHRLYVSSLTWHPGDATDADGKFSLAQKASPGPLRQLSLVDGNVCRTPDAAVELGTKLRDLYDRGVLMLAAEHECEPHAVADIETSWKAAGLVWRPTNETFCAVTTADRLGVNLISEDSDVRRLARHWKVHVMTVAEFAAALAA